MGPVPWHQGHVLLARLPEKDRPLLTKRDSLMDLDHFGLRLKAEVENGRTTPKNTAQMIEFGLWSTEYGVRGLGQSSLMGTFVFYGETAMCGQHEEYIYHVCPLSFLHSLILITSSLSLSLALSILWSYTLPTTLWCWFSPTRHEHLGLRLAIIKHGCQSP